ncbi:hypothetical protein D9M72_492800 [compost metagenome]
MSVDTHTRNARQAESDVEYWTSRAEESRKHVEFCEKVAANRARDAEWFRSLAEREQKAIDLIYAEIERAA